jgi:DNA-binding NtrC family response regulator
VPIVAPPLREHNEDLPELIDFFARGLEMEGETRFSEQALEAMRRYDWPGNVRELSNAVEHAIVLREGPEIGLADLPTAIQDSERIHAIEDKQDSTRAIEGATTLEDIEMNCILHALDKTNFNQTQAARLLGVTRRRLGYRIAKYGLDTRLEERRRSAPRGPGSPPARTS